MTQEGLSVPDAATLQKLADVLETEVSQLLGADIHSERNKNEIAEQLSRINEQLIIKNRRSRRIWKTIGIIFLIIFICNTLLSMAGIMAFDSVKVTKKEPVVEEEFLIEEP